MTITINEYGYCEGDNADEICAAITSGKCSDGKDTKTGYTYGVEPVHSDEDGSLLCGVKRLVESSASHSRTVSEWYKRDSE